MIKVVCQRCKWRFAVLEEMLGKTDRCPQCGQPMPITADGANPPAAPPIALWQTFVLTDQAVLPRRLSREALDGYIRAIDGAIQAQVAPIPPKQGSDLIVKGVLMPEKKPDLNIYMLPATATFDEKTLAGIFQTLFAIPAPAVKEGNVEFSVFFQLWGGSGQLVLKEKTTVTP
jgi:hypothetical protein